MEPLKIEAKFPVKTRTNFHKTIDKIKIYVKINSLKIKLNFIEKIKFKLFKIKKLKNLNKKQN